MIKMTQIETVELTLPVSSERDHTLGSDTAPVTLVEYGDYECPYCGQAYPIIKRIQKRLGDNLRFVFRNFPITRSHPHAQHAAEAAEAAAAQNRFWEMHDHLYEHQQNLDDDNLMQYASVFGMDTARFGDELARHVYADRVREDFMSGIRSGVNGTPTFYINEIRYDYSWDEKTLLTAIEQILEDSSNHQSSKKKKRATAGARRKMGKSRV
jgi:protein-disulfide isomerase